MIIDWRGHEVTVITRDELMARNIAHILGPSCAAAAALQEAYARRERGDMGSWQSPSIEEARRERGEKVEIRLHGKTWTVGPAAHQKAG